jgi:hypothetical protein
LKNIVQSTEFKATSVPNWTRSFLSCSLSDRDNICRRNDTRNQWFLSSENVGNHRNMLQVSKYSMMYPLAACYCWYDTIYRFFSFCDLLNPKFQLRPVKSWAAWLMNARFTCKVCFSSEQLFLWGISSSSDWTLELTHAAILDIFFLIDVLISAFSWIQSRIVVSERM